MKVIDGSDFFLVPMSVASEIRRAMDGGERDLALIWRTHSGGTDRRAYMMAVRVVGLEEVSQS